MTNLFSQVDPNDFSSTLALIQNKQKVIYHKEKLWKSQEFIIILSTEV